MHFFWKRLGKLQWVRSVWSSRKCQLNFGHLKTNEHLCANSWNSFPIHREHLEAINLLLQNCWIVFLGELTFSKEIHQVYDGVTFMRWLLIPWGEKDARYSVSYKCLETWLSCSRKWSYTMEENNCPCSSFSRIVLSRKERGVISI